MDFNKQKCLELMRESNKLRQQGKSLLDYDKAKNKELTHYLTLLSDDIFWENRYQYLQIIESFLSRSIEIDELIKKLDDLIGSNRNAAKLREKNLENEIDFQLNPESIGFTRIISSLDAIIELFDPDTTLEMNLKYPELIGYGISEELLKRDLKNHFLPRILEYCKKS